MEFINHFINVWNNSGEIRFFGYVLLSVIAILFVTFIVEDVIGAGNENA